MASRDMYFGANFNTVPCPVCGAMFSRCGLPNHIRRHQHLALQRSRKDHINRRSPAWWDGWKEGYKLGMRDGANGVRKTIAKANDGIGSKRTRPAGTVPDKGPRRIRQRAGEDSYRAGAQVARPHPNRLSPLFARSFSECASDRAEVYCPTARASVKNEPKRVLSILKPPHHGRKLPRSSPSSPSERGEKK